MVLTSKAKPKSIRSQPIRTGDSWYSSNDDEYSESETWSNASTYSTESPSRSQSQLGRHDPIPRSGSGSRSRSSSRSARQGDGATETGELVRSHRHHHHKSRHHSDEEQEGEEDDYLAQFADIDDYIRGQASGNPTAASASFPPVPLQPFHNQVGGHSAIYKFTKRAVCKVSTWSASEA